MNTRRSSALAFFLVLSLLAPALSAAQEMPAPSGPRHSLWRVEGRSNVVYVVGSLHLLKPTDYPLPGAFEAAYTNSRVVVFETDMSRMHSPEMQLKLMSQATLPEGRTLEQELSPELHAAFLGRVRDAGLPGALFARMKPSMAALTLSLLELQKLGIDPAYGVDQHFFAKAVEDGKEIVSLETVEFQISLLTDFTKEEGELLMKVTLDQIDETRKLYGEIVNAWKAGDTETVERALNDSLREVPAMFKRFLTDRNQRWVPKIRELLGRSENALVVVGAGHLVGKEGLLELLRREGFKVTQL